MIRAHRARAIFCTTLAAGLLLVAGCGDQQPDHGDDHAAKPGATSATPSAEQSPEQSAHSGHHSNKPVAAKPLRAGERFSEVKMPEPYTPSAPYGTGTDDYRCFMLDPKLDADAYLTGIDVNPGDPDVVHHVIMFQAQPHEIAQAEELDAAEPGLGWTCFGGSGLGKGDRLGENGWIGAWAPGGGESTHKPGFGIKLAQGSRIVMQVHYNLLAGKKPDQSGAKLRLSSASDMTELRTFLLPAPVELPCRMGKESPLCNRDVAMKDVVKRFGEGPGRIGDALHILCGAGKVGPTQSCTRNATEPMTIQAAAGHMHLLGRSIKIEVNGKKVLDIPVWDFDNQGAHRVKPVKVNPGDKMTVTCTHDQAIRDLHPSFEGQDERYVVWGEGTTDEMCLGTLLVSEGS